MDESVKKSILEMARGGILERTDYEMAKIIDNICDVNTSPTKKRVLTITVELTPDNDRRQISVRTTAKSKLEPTNPVATSLYLQADPSTGEMLAVEMVPQIPGQQHMSGEEQESPKVLKIARLA